MLRQNNAWTWIDRLWEIDGSVFNGILISMNQRKLKFYFWNSILRTISNCTLVFNK